MSLQIYLSGQRAFVSGVTSGIGAEIAKNCSEDAWEECINLNLAAHWRLAQAARPHLKASSVSPFQIKPNFFRNSSTAERARPLRHR